STKGLVMGSDEKYTKMLLDYKVNKKNLCEETWYDWFTVTDYHLGNKYDKVKNETDGSTTCYSPCPSYSIPAYATDPVSGETSSMFDRTDNLGTCVSRSSYFAGKYQTGSKYCPLTRIHRIYNSVRPDINSYVQNKYTDNNVAFDDDQPQHSPEQGIRLSQLQNNSVNTKLTVEQQFDIYNSNVHVAYKNAQANRVATVLKNIPKDEMVNVVNPSYQDLQRACEGLNTKPRVTEAYKICKELNDLESLPKAEREKQQLALYNNDSSKLNMMKQACSYVFCNDKNNALNDYVDSSALGPKGDKPKLCFQVATFNPQAQSKAEISQPVPDIEKTGFGASFLG
ncbi:MAG: hypothetical protein EB127_31950, partial [Alphaproteobacteria bacterium]|nr:hypothetical protein [Alphaproteobacteria bacterium]